MPSPSSEPQFATPLVVDDPAECQFYHRMEVPGVGEVGGQWDLRACIGEYLGNYDFTGKRALDVGAASGFLTFSMETRGAEVVSFDMASGDQWDVVPQKRVRKDPEGHYARLRQGNDRLQNAYWFTHARVGSKAKVYYGDVYDVPRELGRFDVAVFGMIITHLRDAFRAIYSVSRLVDGDLIITNPTPNIAGAAALFVPSAESGETQAWWVFSEECIKKMLSVIGFEVARTVKSEALRVVPGREGPQTCTAIVAKRIEPLEDG